MSATSTMLVEPTVQASAVSRVEAIPAATAQCHASNLLQLPDGTLLCTWFGGTQEGTADISVYLSRRLPGSASWSQPARISSDPNRSEQNPILFRDPASGMLWLFHTAQPAGNQNEAEVVARTSADQGVTWSSPISPFPEKRGLFVRQPVVVLPNGTWVLPAWYCRSPPGFRWNGTDDVSTVLFSKDSGKTWEEKPVPESRGCVHMNIVPLTEESGGGYVSFFRSRWADNVYRSTSKDGIDWAAPEKTALANPNSGICAAVLGNGDLAIVFNDSCASVGMQRREGLYDDITSEDDTRSNQPQVDGRSAIWGTPRKALSVGLSKDHGKTWKYKVLEDGDGFCMTNNSVEKTNRELSYPSIYVDTNDPKAAHIAYTYHRQYIKYVHVADVE
ncbi:glycosyl hydrolase, partial [Thozetella sp. PMI_491]